MSAILEVILSLLLVYLVFSIVVTGVQEWLAQALSSRGRFLREGVCKLVGDEAIFVRVLQHPLVGSLYRDRAARGKPPSYIGSANFALALANVVVRRATPAAADGTPAAAQPLTHALLRTALQNLNAQRSPLASALLPIVDQAEGDLTRALAGIERWYTTGMDRVSGWYKAHAQKSIFALGLLIALVANVDSIELFRALNRSPELRAQYAGIATEVGRSGKIADVDVAALRERPPTEAEWKKILNAAVEAGAGAARLPIGYGCLSAAAATGDSKQSVWSACRDEFKAMHARMTVSDWLLKLLGLTLTALAGVLGAPYWFGALSKVVNIRGAGPKPAPAAPRIPPDA